MQNIIINDYNIKSEIGRGGMATVYQAHDNKFKIDIALKILNKEFVHNENIRKRFIAEARSMFKMSHPNIIKVTDLIEDGETVAFVMEYVEGETLKQYIDRKGKLKDKEIKDIFSQMLDALAYVHEQKLIHRDIKPSNFMIDNKGKVKLMDFGIAKNTDSSSAEYTSTGTSQSMGTPLYMSPEQVKSTKEVTLQSDIYSLGVVLWHMVKGEKPYNSDTFSTFELQTKIVNEKLPLTSTHFDAIIEKATAKNLNGRYKSCEEFKNTLLYTKKKSTESTKIYTSQKNEQIIIDSSADKTVIQNTEQPEIISPPTKVTPQVEESNSKFIYVILGVILFILALAIGANNNNKTYEIGSDSTIVAADTVFVDSAAYTPESEYDNSVADTAAAK